MASSTWPRPMPPHSSGMCGSQRPGLLRLRAHAEEHVDVLGASRCWSGSPISASPGLTTSSMKARTRSADLLELGGEGEVDGHGGHRRSCVQSDESRAAARGDAAQLRTRADRRSASRSRGSTVRASFIHVRLIMSSALPLQLAAGAAASGERSAAAISCISSVRACSAVPDSTLKSAVPTVMEMIRLDFSGPGSSLTAVMVVIGAIWMAHCRPTCDHSSPFGPDTRIAATDSRRNLQSGPGLWIVGAASVMPRGPRSRPVANTTCPSLAKPRPKSEPTDDEREIAPRRADRPRSAHDESEPVPQRHRLSSCLTGGGEGN